MHFEMLSAIRFKLDQSKIVSSGDVLKTVKQTIDHCHFEQHFNSTQNPGDSFSNLLHKILLKPLAAFPLN